MHRTRLQFTGFASIRSCLPVSVDAQRRDSPRRLLPCSAPLLAILLALTGCSSDKETEQSPVVTVQVAPAETEDIARTVVADALLYPHDQAAIVPKISAPIKKVFVRRGSQVRSGQLLAELESQDLAGAVADSQGSYQQAEAGYAQAVQKAQQDLKVAQEQLDAARKVYGSRQKLYEQGAVSAKDVQDAQIALTQAQSQYDNAQKEFDLKSAEGQLASAKGKQASAEAQLSYSKIVSPIDGVVTDSPFYAGETPPAGTPVITVMDLSRVVARAHISQQDAASLKVGDAATITSPDVPGDCPGKVTLVSPALDPGSSTVEVWVEAANRNERLKPGSSAKVSIEAQRVAKAVVIPAAALLAGDDGAMSVIVLGADGQPDKVAVQTGIRNADDVQILKGVKSGDKVVTTGAFELSQEDPDVLAKTKVQVQAAGADADDDKDQAGKGEDDKAGKGEKDP